MDSSTDIYAHASSLFLPTISLFFRTCVCVCKSIAVVRISDQSAIQQQHQACSVLSSLILTVTLCRRARHSYSGSNAANLNRKSWINAREMRIVHARTHARGGNDRRRRGDAGRKRIIKKSEGSRERERMKKKTGESFTVPVVVV